MPGPGPPAVSASPPLWPGPRALQRSWRVQLRSSQTGRRTLTWSDHNNIIVIIIIIIITDLTRATAGLSASWGRWIVTGTWETTKYLYWSIFFLLSKRFATSQSICERENRDLRVAESDGVVELLVLELGLAHGSRVLNKCLMDSFQFMWIRLKWPTWGWETGLATGRTEGSTWKPSWSATYWTYEYNFHLIHSF